VSPLTQGLRYHTACDLPTYYQFTWYTRLGGCYGRKRLLGREPEGALRLEHGVRHLAFGQVWAELFKYPIVHLLT